MTTVMRQGHKLDTSTARRLAWAEDKLGFELTVVQGSYNGGRVSASAGTHDGGGVVDIRTWNLTETQRQRALAVLREAGLIAWYRTEAQGFDPHIHAVELASTTLSPGAARQRAAYQRGRNGLASDGPDDGPKVSIPTALPDESQEDDMSQYDEVLARIDRNAAAAAERANRNSAVLTNLEKAVNTIARYVPVTHRWVGYLLPAAERTEKGLADVRAAVDAALAEESNEQAREKLEKIRDVLEAGA